MPYPLFRRLMALIRHEASFEIRSHGEDVVVTWGTYRSYEAAKRWIEEKQFEWAAKGGTMYITKINRTGEVERLCFE